MTGFKGPLVMLLGRRKYMARVLAALSLLLITPMAWASCYRVISSTQPIQVIFSFGTIDISSTPGTGRIASTTATAPALNYYCNSSSPPANSAYLTFGLPTSYGSGRWASQDIATNIPGIILRVFYSARQFNYLGGQYRCTANEFTGCPLPGMTLQAELWKTTSGPVTPGPIFKAMQYLEFQNVFFGNDKGVFFGDGSTLYKLYVNGGTIIPGTCAVQDGSKAITQTLPDLSMNDMKDVGWTSPFQAMPPITLTCRGTGVKVTASLSDQTTPANRSNVLSVQTGSGAATGVGLQIGISASGTATAMQTPWIVSNSPGSNMTVQLYSRYYQAAAAPTSGSVTGKATLTFNYN